MTPHVLPTPGWLARQAGTYGQEALLCLLAAGLLVAAADGDPEVFYTELAAAGSFGLKDVLTGLWNDAGEDYPYLEHAKPLTDWLVTSDPARLAAACRLAGVLADVDIVGAEKAVHGDLLGRVYEQMIAINRRMQEPLRVYPLPLMVLAAVRDLDTLKRYAADGKGWLDGACLSGVRSLGMVIALRAVGVDTDTITVALRDPDPRWVAIAAVNFALIAHKGPLHLTVGPAIVSTQLYPDRFSVKSIDEARADAVATPDGWDCADWEIAVAEARDRADLIDEVIDTIGTANWVHTLGVAGYTRNDLAAAMSIAGGYDLDDTTVDYGPARPTRPRVKRKKRVRPRRRR